MDRTLTDITDGGPNLNQFWVRSLGFSKEFSHIKMLHQLSTAEKLLAALLRRDHAVAKEILDSHNQSTDLLEQLSELVRMESFGCIIYDRIVSLNLAGDLQRVCDSSAASFAKIRMMSLVEAANHYQLDEKFARVLALTREFHSTTLWVKGAHLSRAVYQPAYFRHFGDLDVIVHPSVLGGFVDSLIKAGFSSFHSPAYCNQIGVGPVNTPLDLITSPVPGWIPSGPITMARKVDGIYVDIVDIKVGPFERGVQALGLERFFAEADQGSCLGSTYLAPSLPDHLQIMLCNFAKNRFKTWRTLLDIHMLAIALNKAPDLWHDFLESCQAESITVTAWVALLIAVDRLSTPIPEAVLAALAPKEKFFSPLLSFTLNPAYVWNSTSLPMMLLNAYTSADRARKLDMLANSLWPSERFLCQYYGTPGENPRFAYCRYLPIHWFVLFMPGGLVRRTLGKFWWSSEAKF